MISSTACAFVFNAQTLHMRIHNHTRTRIAHHHRQNHHSHTLTQTAHTTTTLTLSTHFTYIQTPLSISSFIHPSSSHEYIHNMYVCNNTMYTMKCTHTHSTSSSITSLHPSTSPLTPSLFLLLHTHTHSTFTSKTFLSLSYTHTRPMRLLHHHSHDVPPPVRVPPSRSARARRALKSITSINTRNPREALEKYPIHREFLIMN